MQHGGGLLQDFHAWFGMRRHLIGICALLLLFSALLAAIMGGEGRWAMLLGAGVRLGIVLAFAWLAWLQLVEITRNRKPWLIGAAAVIVLLALFNSQWLLPIAVPIALAFAGMWFWGWLMKPPAGRTPDGPPKGKRP